MQQRGVHKRSHSSPAYMPSSLRLNSPGKHAGKLNKNKNRKSSPGFKARKVFCCPEEVTSEGTMDTDGVFVTLRARPLLVKKESEVKTALKKKLQNGTRYDGNQAKKSVQSSSGNNALKDISHPTSDLRHINGNAMLESHPCSRDNPPLDYHPSGGLGSDYPHPFGHDMAFLECPLLAEDRCPNCFTDYRTWHNPSSITDNPSRVRDNSLGISDYPSTTDYHTWNRPLLITDNPSRIRDNSLHIFDYPSTTSDNPSQIVDHPSPGRTVNPQSMDYLSNSKDNFDKKLFINNNNYVFQYPSSNSENTLDFVNYPSNAVMDNPQSMDYSSNAHVNPIGTSEAYARSKGISSPARVCPYIVSRSSFAKENNVQNQTMDYPFNPQDDLSSHEESPLLGSEDPLSETDFPIEYQRQTPPYDNPSKSKDYPETDGELSDNPLFYVQARPMIDNDSFPYTKCHSAKVKDLSVINEGFLVSPQGANPLPLPKRDYPTAQQKSVSFEIYSSKNVHSTPSRDYQEFDTLESRSSLDDPESDGLIVRDYPTLTGQCKSRDGNLLNSGRMTSQASDYQEDDRDVSVPTRDYPSRVLDHPLSPVDYLPAVQSPQDYPSVMMDMPSLQWDYEDIKVAPPTDLPVTNNTHSRMDNPKVQVDYTKYKDYLDMVSPITLSSSGYHSEDHHSNLNTNSFASDSIHGNQTYIDPNGGFQLPHDTFSRHGDWPCCHDNGDGQGGSVVDGVIWMSKRLSRCMVDELSLLDNSLVDTSQDPLVNIQDTAPNTTQNIHPNTSVNIQDTTLNTTRDIQDTTPNTSRDIQDTALNTRNIQDTALNTSRDIPDTDLNKTQTFQDTALNTRQNIQDSSPNTIQDIRDTAPNTRQNNQDTDLNTTLDIQDTTLNIIRDIQDTALSTTQNIQSTAVDTKSSILDMIVNNQYNAQDTTSYIQEIAQDTKANILDTNVDKKDSAQDTRVNIQDTLDTRDILDRVGNTWYTALDTKDILYYTGNIEDTALDTNIILDTTGNIEDTALDTKYILDSTGNIEDTALDTKIILDTPWYIEDTALDRNTVLFTIRNQSDKVCVILTFLFIILMFPGG